MYGQGPKITIEKEADTTHACVKYLLFHFGKSLCRVRAFTARSGCQIFRHPAVKLLWEDEHKLCVLHAGNADRANLRKILFDKADVLAPGVFLRFAVPVDQTAGGLRRLLGLKLFADQKILRMVRLE